MCVCVEVTVREAMDCVDIVHYRLCMYHRLAETHPQPLADHDYINQCL